jgi:hypothetical protein
MILYPVILLKACVIVMILAPIFFAVIVALAIAELVRSWQDARGVIAQTQAELAETDAHAALALAIWEELNCPLCRPGGHGRCICTTDCRHPRCTYDHTALNMLTAEDATWLRGLGMTEGER